MVLLGGGGETTFKRGVVSLKRVEIVRHRIGILCKS